LSTRVVTTSTLPAWPSTESVEVPCAPHASSIRQDGSARPEKSVAIAPLSRSIR
jgi:hypothetical protein